MNPEPIFARRLRKYALMYPLIVWFGLTVYMLKIWIVTGFLESIMTYAAVGVALGWVPLALIFRRIARAERVRGNLPTPRGWRERLTVYALNYGAATMYWFGFNQLFSEKSFAAELNQALFMGALFAVWFPQSLLSTEKATWQDLPWPRWKWLDRKIPWT